MGGWGEGAVGGAGVRVLGMGNRFTDGCMGVWGGVLWLGTVTGGI